MNNDQQQRHLSSSDNDVDYPNPSLIYSAPTVETLGDDSASIRPYATPRPNNPRHPSTATSNRGAHTALSSSSSSVLSASVVAGTSKQNNMEALSSSMWKKNNQAASSSSVTTRSHRQQQQSKGKQQAGHSKSSNVRHHHQHHQIADKEFQKPEDAMSVAIRTIPVAERSAFEMQPAPSLSELLGTTNSSSNSSSFSSSKRPKRTSPSPQHLLLIHKLQSIAHVRELAFSPSVGSSSDVLYPGDSSPLLVEERQRRRKNRRSTSTLGGTNNNNNNSGSTTIHTSSSNIAAVGSLSDDGRYRSIDPVQATLNDLPSTPPLLSNKRYRLPMRADVGFPNASPEEIQNKQKEINHETEWEEASPRLIVLVTSDDLGTAAIDPITTATNDGGLLSIPFAGPELVAAKWQNQEHFSKNKPQQQRQRSQQQQSNSSVTNKNENQESYQAGTTANRYSMLAPPLGATFSSTVGWRPRPFHDRPPGLRYTLVSPLTVEFAIGNIEPLVCSLSLYKLGGDSSSATTTTVMGKTTEEFYFPAGNWEGRLQIDALQGDAALTEQWLNRKHKALFALDPLVVPTQDLYIVLQIYKVTHLELATAYVTGTSESYPEDEQQEQQQPHSSDRKSWRKRLKKQFQKDKATPEAQIHRTSYRASNVFEAFGTQFLSPLCFGVTPLHHSTSSPDDHAWPAGQIHNDMALFAYPSHPESQEDFVQRLCRMVAPSRTNSSAVSNAGSSSVASFSLGQSPTATPNTASTTSTTDELTSFNRRKGISRFISPKKASKRDLDDSDVTNSSKKVENTPMIRARVSLFVSDLQADFLESMLQSPPELADKGTVVLPASSSSEDSPALPKLLVDVSGSCAIMMDPTKELGVNDSNKRSNLVRLPPTPKGYLDASDFREVWFLPPMPPKQYSVDPPPSYRSLVNLLYLYPRLLRQSGATETKSSPFRKSSKQPPSRYTIRVRLVESFTESKPESGAVEAHTAVMKNFHNPAPWAGPSMLKSVYTKIPGDAQPEDLNVGIPLQDEFKLRLPTVLDGNQFLQFTLCTVEFSDDLDDSSSAEHISSDDPSGISVRHLAEASIPLSSYATRDPASGTKVTTIIPNGCHRLKLGDFQLQVETRLLSSIHVSDPSLATALREFPLALADDAEIHELALATKSKSAPEKIMFSSLFASADPTALLSHFQPLLFMHLTNLVQDSQGEKPTSERFLTDCMDSLLEICSRIRESVLESGAVGQQRLQAFIKATIDVYDETYFSPSRMHGGIEDEDAASEAVPVEVADSVDLSASDGDEDDEFDGGAIRKRRKDSIRTEIDTRISRTFSAMESPQAGFLRTAYGATKTDRMRLEAELDADTGRYTHLVDDDETVVTFATGYSGEARMVEAREAFERSKAPKAQDQHTVNSLEDRSIGLAPSRDFSYKSLSETELAKRVRSAAKVMLAPCVPPNFFNSSPRNSSWQEEKTPTDAGDLTVIHEDGSENSQLQDRIIATPGSDVDEGEANFSHGAKDPLSEMFLTSDVGFRSPWHCPILRLSVGFDPSDPAGFLPPIKAAFVYESILLLWVRHTESLDTKKGFSNGVPFNLAVSPLEILPPSEPIYKFYGNMDLLLPLCLKSIALRFGQAIKNSNSPTARVVVDKEQMGIFESLFETLPLLLMKDAMMHSKSSDKDRVLQHVLSKSEPILDFLIGLYAILHPAHVSVLTKKFFQNLRYAETAGVEMQGGDSKFEWTEENLYRVRCSRQLRLRAVEKLAVLPNFVALNYPMRFPNRRLRVRVNKASWTSQYAAAVKDEPLRSEDLLNDGDGLLPPSGWLAEILTRESLSITALSCEAVVAEAMAHIEEKESKSSSSPRSALKKRPTATLTRDDLLMFQSIAIHGITCVHELLLRRHAMDKRYQKESTRGRIAALFAIPIFEKSLASVRWLARMESTHRVRSLWLLCFTYVLQEAPENLLREAISSYSNSRDSQIHRFVRLLRLSSSTFQSFIDQQRYCMFPLEIDAGISPWLLQESFNTICATTIIVVEECANSTSTSPTDQKRLIQGILDLLLHILTTPQSPVTHLRAVGGAIQALERFGAAMFLESTGGSLQHWIRVVTGLMNSISLSVRSIAVDFVVSMLGSSFDLYGSIDELAIIFATVLPEVAAREIGLCSVSGYIHSLEDAERAIWPLRRSFADLEDANPLDDDRVDPQLSPVLSVFCRACQAVLDGVLIELRLQGNTCDIVGTKIKPNPMEMYTLDADEESLFEAANFFLPENAPLQRIRWLMTLKSLHRAKGQWVESAESLIMCARAIADSMLHLNNVWRPSRFPLWSDSRRSLWLSTVGEDLGIPERGNEQVMSFADKFLEPELFDAATTSTTECGKLKQPTVSGMCPLLTAVAKEAVAMYDQEGGMDGLAYLRLESLLMILMDVLEAHGVNEGGAGRYRTRGVSGRRRQVEEEASLRKVIAGISGDMTKLAERMLLLVEVASPVLSPTSPRSENRQHYFVRIALSGKKPTRFMESTTLPTFLDWDKPCICRAPKAFVDKALASVGRKSDRLEEVMCSLFGKPIRNALLRDGIPSNSIVLRLGRQALKAVDTVNAIIVDIGFAQMSFSEHRNGADQATTMNSPQHKRDALLGSSNYDGRNLLSKHFIYRKPPNASEVISSTFVEMTVATPFPCPLSRQRSLLTSEVASAK